MQDDAREYWRRFSFGVLLGGLSLLIQSNLFQSISERFTAISTLVVASPLSLAIALLGFLVWPQKSSRLKCSYSARPRPRQPGNPLLAQSNNLGCWAMMALLAAFTGCVGLNLSEDSMPTAIPLGHVSLVMLLVAILGHRYWLELDVESLSLLRHRVFLGLQQTSRALPDPIQALAICCPYRFAIYALTARGENHCLSASYNELKEARIEALRLADRLQVPLLLDGEEMPPERLGQILRSGRIPDVHNDWPTPAVSETLLQHRSPLPPVD